MRILPPLFALAMTAGNLWAGLAWETQRIELAAQPADTQAEAKFTFVNSGSRPVTIGSIKSSCGCTTAQLAKTTFRPGERGEVTARFEFGQRRGIQTKTVSVAIQGEQPATVLTLVVAIPEQARLTPGIVVWEKGAEAETKRIVIEALPRFPTRVTGAVSTDARIAVAVEAVKESGEYVLKVTPQTTEMPLFSILNIETEWQGRRKTFQAYAQIRPVAQ